MLRIHLIEQITRQVYGGQPTDDASITPTLVNQYINQGVAIAAKQCYVESIKLDGVAYMNNSFYCMYKGLAVAPYEEFTYQITLPHIPFGLGHNEGVASLQLKDGNNVTHTGIPLTTFQQSYKSALKKPYNKFLYWSEGIFCYVESPVLLFNVTANVRLVSSGDHTNLNSVLNVPEEYIGIVVDYATKMLLLERAQKQDVNNDGVATV